MWSANQELFRHVIVLYEKDLIVGDGFIVGHAAESVGCKSAEKHADVCECYAESWTLRRVMQ